MQILIAGLAKTGTTGLLYLLNDAFPKPPKLLFEPKSCAPETLAQHPDLLAKIIIDPKLDWSGFLPFARKITLVRDPRDRMVSAMLYSQYHADYLGDDAKVERIRTLLERKERDPKSVSVGGILEAMGDVAGKSARASAHAGHFKRLMDVFDAWCAATPDALLYRYEDFVEGRFEPLEDHLGRPIVGQAEVPKTLKRVERTRDSGSWRHWFTEDDVQLFRPAFGSWLARYGYDADDWAVEATPTIDPDHASRYYMRLVSECRAKGRVPESGRQDTAGSRLNAGHVQRADPDAVTGWAVGPDADQPVRVILKINGRKVTETLADKARPVFVERGLHPTGRCGFVFRPTGTAQWREGDEITVEPVGADFTLRNSPRRVTAVAPH